MCEFKIYDEQRRFILIGVQLDQKLIYTKSKFLITKVFR